MSYFLRRASIVLLAAMISVGADSRTRQSRRQTEKARHVGMKCDPHKLTFHSTIAADGFSADGTTRLSYYLYKSSEGIVLQTVYGEFDSSSAANGELAYRARSASKIIVNGWRLDANGHVMGRRVEAFALSANPKKASVFVVMWTWGRYFHELTSNCKKAVLYTEKNTHNP